MQVLVRVLSLFDIPPSDQIFNVTVRSQAIDYDCYSLAPALYPKQPFSNIFSLFHLHKSLSLPLSIARFVSPVGLCELRSHVFPLVEAQPNMELYVIQSTPRPASLGSTTVVNQLAGGSRYGTLFLKCYFTSHILYLI